MQSLPTRELTIQIAEQLIDGSKTPYEVGEWAIAIQSDQNLAQQLEDEDPVLEEFITLLGMVGMPAGAHTDDKLYGKEDYIAWLQEFKEKTPL